MAFPTEAEGSAEEQPEGECVAEGQSEAVPLDVVDPAAPKSAPLLLAAALAQAVAEPANTDGEAVAVLQRVAAPVLVSNCETVRAPLLVGLRVAPPLRLPDGEALAQEVVDAAAAVSVAKGEAEEWGVGVAAAAVALRMELPVPAGAEAVAAREGVGGAVGEGSCEGLVDTEAQPLAEGRALPLAVDWGPLADSAAVPLKCGLGDANPLAQALADGEAHCEVDSLPRPLLESSALPERETQPLPDSLKLAVPVKEAVALLLRLTGGVAVTLLLASDAL